MKSLSNYLTHVFLVLFITATVVPLVFRGGGAYPITCVVSLTIVLLCTKLRTLKGIRSSQVLFFFYCFLFVIISSILTNSPQGRIVIREYTLFYLIAGLGSLLIINYKYDFELFLKSLIIIALLISPFVLNSNYSTLLYEADNDEWMGAIYAITPFLVGCIYYFFVGEKRLFKALAILVLIFYFSMFIMHTPRGAVVTVMASIMVFTLQRMLDNGWKMKNVILMSVMVVVLLVIVSEVLLVFLQDVATDYELRWLVKFVLDEDVSNNRAPLYQQAWSGFLDSPLWGQGVATFNNFSGYPHNLFLQMLYETGILMIIPISFFILKAIKTIVIRNAANGYDYRFVTFFFLISMNQLMFSSYFWRNHCFWLMIWCIIGILYRKTQNNPQKLKY